MSTRTLAVAVLIVAALLVGWRVLLPASHEASQQAAAGAAAILDTTTRAELTGAQATLEIQRRSTGSYAGAVLAPPVSLVRADAASYCIQVQAGSTVAHVAGPNGAPQPGACS